MFASLPAFALAAQQIVVPLGPASQPVERARAPIEQAGPQWVEACGGSTAWDQPAPPVRIHGNTYLVGTCGIAAILITGREGHILIDAGTETGAEVVAANIRALGFQLKDVKYLLHSHEHLDHVGGIARLQQLTGGQLVASAAAAKVFATGANGASDPQTGMHKPFRAARVDRVVGDGDSVRLGELLLTAIATPGHTPGALSWSWGSCDGGICRRLVYADSLSAISSNTYRFSDHPAYVAAFRAGLSRLAAVDCDILLTPHPAASNLPARMSGRAPLISTQACRDYVASAGKRLDERLAREAAPK